jgi:hypothetical protein
MIIERLTENHSEDQPQFLSLHKRLQPPPAASRILPLRVTQTAFDSYISRESKAFDGKICGKASGRRGRWRVEVVALMQAEATGVVRHGTSWLAYYYSASNLKPTRRIKWPKRAKWWGP